MQLPPISPGCRWIFTMTAGLWLIHADCSVFSAPSTTLAPSCTRTAAPLRYAITTDLARLPLDIHNDRWYLVHPRRLQRVLSAIHNIGYVLHAHGSAIAICNYD